MLKEILRKSALFLFKIFDQNKSRGKSKILCQLLFCLEPGISALNNLLCGDYRRSNTLLP